MSGYPLPSLDLARREIDEDAACRRLALPDRHRLARRCWSLGRGAAAAWLPRDLGQLRSFLSDQGLRVLEDEEELGRWGGFVSEYRPRGRLIVLHRGALRQWADAEADAGVDAHPAGGRSGEGFGRSGAGSGGIGAGFAGGFGGNFGGPPDSNTGGPSGDGHLPVLGEASGPAGAQIPAWVAEGPLSPELLERIALAHEFFHDLDCQGLVDTSGVSRVRTWSLGGRPVWHTTSRGAVEACAHGFASAVLARP